MGVQPSQLGLRTSLYWLCLTRDDLWNDMVELANPRPLAQTDWARFLGIPTEVLEDVQRTIQANRPAFEQVRALIYPPCPYPPCPDDYRMRIIVDLNRVGPYAR